MNKKLIVTTLACLSSSASFAAEQTGTPEWKASAELGYVSTSGNTETNTLNAKASMSTERDKWRHKLDITALNTSDNLGTTAEKYTVTGQSDYKLKAPNYLFANINYEKDKFSNFDYQVSETVGFGRRVIDDKTMKLDLEIGPGARQSKVENASTENEATVKAGVKLDWTVSKSSQFAEELTVEAGEETTITKSITSLTSKVDTDLSMKLTYTFKQTSEAAAGFDDTDTETAVTLVYTF